MALCFAIWPEQVLSGAGGTKSSGRVPYFRRVGIFISPLLWFFDERKKYLQVRKKV